MEREGICGVVRGGALNGGGLWGALGGSRGLRRAVVLAPAHEKVHLANHAYGMALAASGRAEEAFLRWSAEDAKIGDTHTKLVTRYDHGPSRIEPSIPTVFLSVGRTSLTDVEPLTPKTQNATAASVRDSRQLGRFWLVHAQNLCRGD